MIIGENISGNEQLLIPHKRISVAHRFEHRSFNAVVADINTRN
ncbi:Uncharacterised protein [Vibrio cholerae]|nr:Uncharacterised protein [Vibrio cholerae]